VVAEEGPPGLARRTGRPAPAVLLDGGLADRDAELEQLAADPLGAPGWILPSHPRDQLPHLGADARAAHRCAGPPAPEQPPALLMPPDHRLRPNQQELLAPVRPDEAGEQPDH